MDSSLNGLKGYSSSVLAQRFLCGLFKTIKSVSLIYRHIKIITCFLLNGLCHTICLSKFIHLISLEVFKFKGRKSVSLHFFFL